MKTTLARANALLREGRLDEALELYAELLEERPALATSIRFNMQLAEKRLRQNRSTLGAAASTPSSRDVVGPAPKAKLKKPDDLESFYFDIIEASGLFDVDWYFEQYRNNHEIADNPLSHYLKFGVREGLNPSLFFDTRNYLANYPDVAAAEIHPFIHYVAQGCQEGRNPLPPPPAVYNSRYAVSPPAYVARLPAAAQPVEKSVKVICFYLPQFHAIPENDAWWGKGFTEWTNVRPAVAQFAGHYQPHVPDDDIGYYNLLDRSAQAEQIALAKQYGIEGFCFYVYWFSGKRLLEQPVDNYLKDPSLDLPFCVCWANENWSRRWDGLERDLLMVQNYADEDDVDFIASVAKYLRDPRYIRIGGRPLLLVYRPNLFPSMKATAGRWRDWCRANGIGEIHLAYPQSFETVDPAVYGLDAAVEFPPNNSNPPDITSRVEPLVEKFEATVYDWRALVERSDAYARPGYPIFRSVCPSWDNTARKKNKGTVFHNNCPRLFTKWLTNAFADTLAHAAHPDEQIVFVNAWNEWAEGAHLEPDKRYGYAWLQAVRDAHQAVAAARRRIVVVSHDAHPHGAQILCLNFSRYLREQFHCDVDLIVLGEGPLIDKYQAYATVHRVDLANEATIDRLLASLRSKGAEMAIVNTTVSGKLVPFLKKHCFAVVSLVHEMPGILESYGLQEHAKLIAKLADKVVFPARQVQEGFESFIGTSLPQAVIRPQGLYLPSLLRQGANKKDVAASVRQKLGLPGHAKIVMCAGYADYRKGFDLFVRAGVMVAKRVPDTYALWVGHLDQKFVDECLKTAADEGLSDRFLFTGLVDRPQEYYLGADVYALTSREDPFPSVVMEALDALTPVVAFRDSGGFENLLRRDCGRLVQREDCSAFADAVVELLESPDRALELATAGRNIVESEFSFSHYLFDLTTLAGKPIPRVSVVVPNYNYENYISQRLETVARQTAPIFELIVLDDCSFDNSVSKIREFLRTCEITSRVEVNAHNSGSVFRQWRTGVEQARGELVWIAEADDVASPDFLARLVSFFDDPKVVLAYSQSRQIDEHGKVLAGDYLEYTNDVGDYWRDDYVVDGIDDVKRALCVKNVIPNVSGVLFRRDALLKVLHQLEEELPSYRVAGDWLVYLHLAAQGKFAFCARSLNSHRRHSRSVTKANNHLEEIVRVHQLISCRVDLGPDRLAAMATYEHYLAGYFATNVNSSADSTAGDQERKSHV